jgi:chitin-binding protein
LVLLASLSVTFGHGLIQDPPSRNWFCGAVTKPDHVLNGVAQYPACGGAFANDFSGGYSFMSVLTHAEGREVVRPLPQNVCGFNSETWQGRSTPWDQPIDWPTTTLSAGPKTFTWNISWGSHFSDTKEFRYWITKPDFRFQVGRPLAWTDFEETPFCSLNYDDSIPSNNPDVVADKTRALFHTRCTVPQRQGRHVIYAEWGRNHFTFERFHGCVDVVFGSTSGFSLLSNEATLRIAPGASVNTTVAIQRTAGFSGSVTFSASGLPPGVSAMFNPAPAPGTSVTLTLVANSSVSPGRSTVTVTGTSGVITSSIPIMVEVDPQPAFSLSSSSEVLSVQKGSSSVRTITIARTAGFSAPVSFTAAGVPAGVTATFDPAQAAGGSTTLTVMASGAAQSGSATILVTGTSNGLTKTVPVPVSINPAAEDRSFTLSISPTSLTLPQGGTATGTVTLSRQGGHNAPVALTATQLPSGVTASFSPASVSGNTTQIALSASKASVIGAGTAIVTGTGGGASNTVTLPFTVTAASAPAAAGVVARVNVNQPWYNELALQFNNTAPITALSVTINVARTPGINFAGQYNTTGSEIQQSTITSPNTIVYKYVLSTGQTLGPSSHRVFAAQASGTGVPHPVAGDTYEVTYTMGGSTFTESGHF